MRAQQQADKTPSGKSLGSLTDQLAIVFERVYWNASNKKEAAIAVLLREAGATYAETAAFIAINGRRP